MTLQEQTNRELREELIASLVVISIQSEMLKVAKEGLMCYGKQYGHGSYAREVLAEIEEMEKRDVRWLARRNN